MNIDPEKVKRLVLLFAELDNDYQKELLDYAQILSIKQSHKNHILKEGKKYKDKEALDKEAEERAIARAKEVQGFLDDLEKLDDEDKAALVVFVDKISGGKITEENDITITINHRNVSMKDYLTERFPGIDCEKVMSRVKGYTKELDQLIEKKK